MMRTYILMTALAVALGSVAYLATRHQLSGRGDHSIGSDHLVVQCKGTTSGWIFRLSGTDGKFHTGDDRVTNNLLILPPHATVRLEVTSDDYLFRLAQRELKINTIAVPDRQMDLSFTTGGPGKYELESQSMCGTPRLHTFDPPKIIVSE